MKKVLAVALSVVAALSAFACSDPNEGAEREVGERIDAEKFEEFVFYGVCCDNYTMRQPIDMSHTVTYGNITMTVVSTGESVMKVTKNAISIYEEYTTVTTTVSVDSSGSESTTVETDVGNETIYLEKDGEKYYVYNYNPTTETWSKSEESSSIYQLYFYENMKAFADAEYESMQSGEGLYAGFKEEMEYYLNVENWTFDETTGEYYLLDWSLNVGVGSVNVGVAMDVYYKFKDGHLIMRRQAGEVMGVEEDQTFYYSNHGTTVVTLPVIEDSSSSSSGTDSSAQS